MSYREWLFSAAQKNSNLKLNILLENRTILTGKNQA